LGAAPPPTTIAKQLATPSSRQAARIKLRTRPKIS
jgi:hypothetical protein